MRTIELTQGKVALVDNADYERVSRFKWSAVKSGERGRFYASRHEPGSRRTIYLHRFLMPGVGRVDHKNGNGLDCQRHNLRPASNAENLRGARRKTAFATSKFRGVSWHKGDHRWQAQIAIDGRRINLGGFKKEKDAAQAYDVSARKLFGEFAAPNFPS